MQVELQAGGVTLFLWPTLHAPLAAPPAHASWQKEARTNGAKCAELGGDELLDGAGLLGSLHQRGLLSQRGAVHSRDYLRG